MRLALLDVGGTAALGVGVGYRLFATVGAPSMGTRAMCHWFGSLQTPTPGNGYDAGPPRFAVGGMRGPGGVLVLQVFQTSFADGARWTGPVPQRIDIP